MNKIITNQDINKPKPLKKGDKIAIVSLSSGILGENSCKHQVKLGTQRLKDMGLIPVFMPNSLKGLKYLEEHPEKRSEDLKLAFQNSEIKAILCAIGGIDGFRLYPYLLEDVEFINLVKNNPKIFIGFSDTTTHHLMFYKLGMMSFYGSSFLNDIAELDKEMLPYTKNYFDLLFNDMKNFDINKNNLNLPYIESSDFWYEERTDFSENSLNIPRNSHKEIHGYELIQENKENTNFSGSLLGGCIESLYNLLEGERFPEQKELCEKYEIFPSQKKWKNKVLFIETAETKSSPEIYKIMLTKLKETGIFNEINGILVGKPQDEAYYEEYKNVLIDVIDNPNLPILYNVNFGHAYPHCILPYGIEIEYNHNDKRIYFKENFFN